MKTKKNERKEKKSNDKKRKKEREKKEGLKTRIRGVNCEWKWVKVKWRIFLSPISLKIGSVVVQDK